MGRDLSSCLFPYKALGGASELSTKCFAWSWIRLSTLPRLISIMIRKRGQIFFKEEVIGMKHILGNHAYRREPEKLVGCWLVD